MTSTPMRRLSTKFPFCAQIFFIESVCDDPSVIESNIMVSRAQTSQWTPALFEMT